ncbi:hypothetical protein EZV62_004662 [Acer yangbiense]|uniref:Leucine-rich repeat-containing N-terminal plant-type domain-containing protein n=1 Tax=Acer yangbiense TaxID=1000413 RepID=A0A5C7IK10_9ROSI|nr:hypothetical protein EZV62_004662 [Acer yangbiense]
MALRTVTDKLRSTITDTLGSRLYITRSYCLWADSFLSAVKVRCTLDNYSVYHITEMSDFMSTIFNSFSESSSKLQGYIHKDLGKLSYLTRLDLSYNQLNGTIPDSLGNLKYLTIL